MENVRRGVREFLLKYSAPTSLSLKAPPLENYTTVVSIHRGCNAEEWIRSFLQEKGWHGKVVIVYDDNNEHIDAMAASDIGLIYDG